MITTNTVENLIITYLFGEGIYPYSLEKKFSYDYDLSDDHKNHGNTRILESWE